MGTSICPRVRACCSWDHPHAYGDKYSYKSKASQAQGSSPRVWGQAINGVSSFIDKRIIPTRMGTSCKNLVNLTEQQDHPHAYGDKKKSSYCLATVAGSSPRVWGQDFFDVSFNASYRIIPTRMGTRRFLSIYIDVNKDHPHAYGDKYFAFIFCTYSIGSSPRVWGQGLLRNRQIFLTRIIPTRMGTSNLHNEHIITYKDHPHAYGDKNRFPFSDVEQLGSSPRVWGQAKALSGDIATRRIIPTRMGTSCSVGVWDAELRDHPHAYGDKSILYVIRLVSLGSSPRVWGQDINGVSSFIEKRIIPTRMGTRRHKTFYYQRT